ncbi:SOS response-associated peptidase [Salimicrobium halophilum]|uniref:Abasic site processing protein n=1 Tax=Salimicrobium halophilum TaxID=86666 RepID=A0A1G8UFE7_9BACI|nr:SOS response-associated peptidase [Salimicrobium halophilum]SDJ52533.1 Putative SOS response-associated peptidase YedK [Salimicrobium halophilum]
MCGRFTLIAELEDMRTEYGVDQIRIDQWQNNYNVAPSQNIPAVIAGAEDRRMGYLRWGLIPPWAEDEKIGFKMINARSETVEEKKSFRKPFKQQRCIIPADSFFEWKKDDLGEKQPYRIQVKGKNLFGFAGLWEKWENEKGEPVFTCTILTTEANREMSGIHHRMPVILRQEEYGAWLDSEEEARNLLRPLPDGTLAMYPVSKRVNTPRNNDAALLEEA